MAQEMRLKEWLMVEAARLGLTTAGVFKRLGRGLYPQIKLRRVNPRLVFVNVAAASAGNGHAHLGRRSEVCDCGKFKPMEASACARCSKTRGAGPVNTRLKNSHRVRPEVCLTGSSNYYDEENYAPIAGGSLAILEARLAGKV